MPDVGWNVALWINLNLWRWSPDGYSIVKFAPMGYIPPGDRIRRPFAIDKTDTLGKPAYRM
jgi:hypothetical protein